MLEWFANASAWNAYTVSASVVSGFATGFAVLIGGISLLLIYFQTRQAAVISQQAMAIGAHKEYIHLCIQHPHLSSSHMMARFLGQEKFNNILNDLSVESEKALWFMSYVLFAMEQLILTNIHHGKVDPAWQSTVEDQLGFHADLLRIVWPGWRSHYSDRMGKIIQSILDRNDVPQA